MKKNIRTFLIAAIAAMNFQGTDKPLALSFTPGTYGGGTPVQLKLDADHTFSYCDRTVRPHLAVTGKWEQEGRIITLRTFSGAKMHDRWKIDAEFPCLRSRTGLNWRRLCLCD